MYNIQRTAQKLVISQYIYIFDKQITAKFSLKCLIYYPSSRYRQSGLKSLLLQDFSIFFNVVLVASRFIEFFEKSYLIFLKSLV